MATQPEDPMTLLLNQLSTITQRLEGLESMVNGRMNSKSITINPSSSSSSKVSIPTFQHGIRAQGLWKNRKFELYKEPMKYSFRLESSKDYTVWSTTILRLLEREGLTPFVLGKVEEPPFSDGDPEEDENAWLYHRFHEFEGAAMAAILNSVGKGQLSLLTRCSTSAEMWNKLKNTYLLDSDVTIANLENELMNISWKRNTKIDDYISEIDSIAEMLRGCGHEVSDSRLKMILLRGLPDRLSNIQHILLDRHDLSYASTCDSLRAHVSLYHRQSEMKESAMAATSNSPSPAKKEKNVKEKNNSEKVQSEHNSVCSTCNKVGHSSERCFRNLTPQQLAEVEKKWTCKLCCQLGHFPKDCPTVKSTENILDASNLAVTMMAVDNNSEDKSEWIIDSGCTIHMCNDAKMVKITESTMNSSRTVTMANGRELKVEGVGSVNLTLRVSTSTIPVTLKNVLLVPELSKNLFSVTACMKQGIDVEFDCEENACKLKKEGKTVGLAKRKFNLWVLDTLGDNPNGSTPISALSAIANCPKVVSATTPHYSGSSASAFCVSGNSLAAGGERAAAAKE